jgi:hypothetical protein
VIRTVVEDDANVVDRVAGDDAARQRFRTLRSERLLEEAGRQEKGRPESKNFPPLDVDARNALELFLQQHGNSFSVHTLTIFYSAGFPAAAGYIHEILKTTQDRYEKLSAVIRLGSRGYEPALDDLLKIFQETPDASLRRAVREEFQWFRDSDRVTKALADAGEVLIIGPASAVCTGRGWCDSGNKPPFRKQIDASSSVRSPRARRSSCRASSSCATVSP